MAINAYMDESELLHRLQTGDETAFTAIYQRYWEKLLAIAYNITKDRSGAEEIVQEVFMRLWDRRSDTTIASLPAYLATAVKFAVFKQLLKEKRRAELLRENYHPDAITQEEARIEARFLEEYLQGIVETLPEKCRLVFRYSRQEALPVQQIAREMNISPKTVEAHLTRALKQLRLSLRNIGSFFS